jgi:hypothetical protein
MTLLEFLVRRFAVSPISRIPIAITAAQGVRSVVVVVILGD